MDHNGCTLLHLTTKHDFKNFAGVIARLLPPSDCGSATLCTANLEVLVSFINSLALATGGLFLNFTAWPVFQSGVPPLRNTNEARLVSCAIHKGVPKFLISSRNLLTLPKFFKWSRIVVTTRNCMFYAFIVLDTQTPITSADKAFCVSEQTRTDSNKTVQTAFVIKLHAKCTSWSRDLEMRKT